MPGIENSDAVVGIAICFLATGAVILIETVQRGCKYGSEGAVLDLRGCSIILRDNLSTRHVVLQAKNQGHSAS